MKKYDGGCSIMISGEHILGVYEWYTDSRLLVNRRYQRKLVWTLDEKRAFIDTILCGYPVPLFLLVETDIRTEGGIGPKCMEIMDGLQRLEAIISFIFNKYPIEVDGTEYYFDLDAIPATRYAVESGELTQLYPTLDVKLCGRFLQYSLPISLISADDVVIDDAFKRINATGRKLSHQDLRQAGVISNFSELVRTLATHLRGDVTEDIINLSEIADYSLSNQGLDYGLNVKEVFWIEHGIMTEDGLRRSKDEEIIAILCSCLLSNYRSSMSVDTLDRLYNEHTTLFKQNENILTPERVDETTGVFTKIFSDLTKIFGTEETTFSKLLFKEQKSYNKDLVFIVVFLAFAQLYTENYIIEDYVSMAHIMRNLADKELRELIDPSDSKWNKEVRNRLIERVKNVLQKHMVFVEGDPHWNVKFSSFLRQVSAEGCMLDFKIGFHDLRTGELNESFVSRCLKTLVAMANTVPRKEGVIVIGVSDKDSDAADFKNYYHEDVPKCNDYYVPGVNAEARKFFGSVQGLVKYVKDAIEKSASLIDRMAIYYILTTIDTMRFNNQTLVVLRLCANKPLFYDEKLYVRYDSHNTELAVGSQEYYEVMDSFYNAK